MSDKEKPANRIPFESLQGSNGVSAWNLPNVSPGSGVVKSAAREAMERTKAKKQRELQRSQESIEDVAIGKKPKPLTAEELMRISEDARKEGYESGYQEGVVKGEKDGFAQGQKTGETKAYTQTRQQRENELARLKSIGLELMQPMLDQQQQFEDVIVEMAVSLAKQLLMHEIQQNPSILYKLVNHALSALPVGAHNISVSLNPEDVSFLQDVLPSISEWNIVEDSSITSGGCKVSTGESLVDFTVETRLKAFLDDVRAHGDIDDSALPPVEDFREPESLLETEELGLPATVLDTANLDGVDHAENDNKTPSERELAEPKPIEQKPIEQKQPEKAGAHTANTKTTEANAAETNTAEIKFAEEKIIESKSGSPATPGYRNTAFETEELSVATPTSGRENNPVKPSLKSASQNAVAEGKPNE